MASDKEVAVYVAVYNNIDDAFSDLDDIEQLHKDDLIGVYDAAIVDQQNGKPHIAKRLDRPRVRVIPEAFGSGTLKRKELHEAAQELEANLVRHDSYRRAHHRAGVRQGRRSHFKRP